MNLLLRFLRGTPAFLVVHSQLLSMLLLGFGLIGSLQAASFSTSHASGQQGAYQARKKRAWYFASKASTPPNESVFFCKAVLSDHASKVLHVAD